MPTKEFYWNNRERLLKQEAERYTRERDKILVRNKAWNASHPEEMNKISKKWSDANPEKRAEIGKKAHKKRKEKSRESIIFWQAKTRAKKAGIPFNIEISDIVIPEFCPVFPEIKLCLTNENTWFDSPSLDKLIPSLGYVKGNIRVISFKANAMKQDASWQEIQRLSEWLKAEVSHAR